MGVLGTLKRMIRVSAIEWCEMLIGVIAVRFYDFERRRLKKDCILTTNEERKEKVQTICEISFSYQYVEHCEGSTKFARKNPDPLD